MALKESYLLLSFVIILTQVAKATITPYVFVTGRSSFPQGFVFGTATAAYQYEGAAFIDGKGPSNWDNYTHQHPERIFNGANGDVAVDQYHRYKEDVTILKSLNFDAYRFSISWSRILPKGKVSGGINLLGVQYYNSLINELLHHGIQPYVTLFHWDVPQALEDEYNGFMSHKIVDDFRDYAELCFKLYGDRVKHWITLNEPSMFSTTGYALGGSPPGRCSSWQTENYCLGGDSATEPYIVSHNQILAHAAAFNLYKTQFQAKQKGIIGITLTTVWFVPYSNSEEDRNASSVALDFNLGWFLDPLTYGDYPKSMRDYLKERLPKFTENETLSIEGSYDFLGLNYYTSNYAKYQYSPDQKPGYFNDIRASLSTDRDGRLIGPKVDNSSWLADYPIGFYEYLVYAKKNYKNPIIYVTENGYLYHDGPDVQKLLKDRARIKYHRGHLSYLHKAIKAGVTIRGYFVWSLLDNFEWATGFTNRFGITYVDKNLTRILKDSAYWFQHFLRN